MISFYLTNLIWRKKEKNAHKLFVNLLCGADNNHVGWCHFVANKFLIFLFCINLLFLVFIQQSWATITAKLCKPSQSYEYSMLENIRWVTRRKKPKLKHRKLLNINTEYRQIFTKWNKQTPNTCIVISLLLRS